MLLEDPHWRTRLVTVLHDSLMPVDVAAGAGDTFAAVSEELGSLDVGALEALVTTGLAHDHVRVNGTRWLLRIPKQSQMRLNAADNLKYQAACFQRMCVGGHTPRCVALVPPSDVLPMGCLVVDYVKGRPLELPEDSPRVAIALASVHRQPLLPADRRVPLIDQATPMADTLREVLEQAAFLSEARCSEASRRAIRHQVRRARREVEQLPEPPACLVAFDAHPGNFLVDGSGRAILVDLEKGRYSGAGFDLAHATLYTSTTWEQHRQCVLSSAEVQDFYATWRREMPDQLVAALAPTLWPMRRLMWLWSLTWCAKWTVLSAASAKTSSESAASTEDWSTEISDDSLIAHVRERVAHYLDADLIAALGDDMEQDPI